jgi:hypothetical protein
MGGTLKDHLGGFGVEGEKFKDPVNFPVMTPKGILRKWTPSGEPEKRQWLTKMPLAKRKKVFL